LEITEFLLNRSCIVSRQQTNTPSDFMDFALYENDTAFFPAHYSVVASHDIMTCHTRMDPLSAAVRKMCPLLARKFRPLTLFGRLEVKRERVITSEKILF